MAFVRKSIAQSLRTHLPVYIILSGIVIHYISCNSSGLHSHLDAEMANLALSKEREAFARGKEIWFDSTIGNNGRNCESCHPNGEMTNAETYPRYKHVLKTMATISMTHNFAVVNESRGKPWELGSDDANALVLFVKSFANGKNIRNVEPNSINKEWVDKGKITFKSTDLGENGESCASCHSGDVKQNRTNNTIKAINLEGVTAIYPKYSFQHNGVITLEQKINSCIETNLNRAPLPLDDAKIIELCCYIKSLSEGGKVSVAQFGK